MELCSAPSPPQEDFSSAAARIYNKPRFPKARFGVEKFSHTPNRILDHCMCQCAAVRVMSRGRNKRERAIHMVELTYLMEILSCCGFQENETFSFIMVSLQCFVFVDFDF